MQAFEKKNTEVYARIVSLCTVETSPREKLLASAIPTQLRRHEFRVRRYRFEAWIIDFYESAFENVIKVDFFCLKKGRGLVGEDCPDDQIKMFGKPHCKV